MYVLAGLEGLHDLRELVLDKNKIKTLTESSFINQWNLQELHMEENRYPLSIKCSITPCNKQLSVLMLVFIRIRELSHLQHLESLQRLYMGMNRIQDLSELEKLAPLSQLMELSLVSCPVSRRLMHRPLLVYRMPSLAVIDGIPVSEEEQIKASIYYSQQEVSPIILFIALIRRLNPIRIILLVPVCLSSNNNKLRSLWTVQAPPCLVSTLLWLVLKVKSLLRSQM